MITPSKKSPRWFLEYLLVKEMIDHLAR